MAQNLTTYDATNRELRTVPEAFAARGKSVLSMVWKSAIKVGSQIDPGTDLVIVQWEDNSRETVSAPAGCAGQVASVNRDVLFENLRFPPSQTLLRFS